MSLRNQVLKAAGIYVLGRLTAHITGDHIARLRSLSGADLRRYGIDGADAVLDAVGLRRRSSVPSSTALVLAGFTAGAVVGTGITFLFFSTQGKEVRRKIVEYFSKADEEETNSRKGSATASSPTPMAS